MLASIKELTLRVLQEAGLQLSRDPQISSEKGNVNLSY
ncbi:hypothetical protein ACVLD2_001435 [Paenibacillus sp. PvR052]|nr:hypothetical protein [Paenibacillus sp. PvP091]MBP1169957.1 hypothetical protein [Paenibacillus sp. PvR098]MBP2440985.1 hypothetical protein [Paenibacillus sp. PvP052]